MELSRSIASSSPTSPANSGKYYLIYFGNDRPKEWTFQLIKDGISDGMKFQVDVIDTWSMTIAHDPRTFTVVKHSPYVFRAEGDAKVDLPGKPFMALRVRRAG